jgi:hypothetical protein
MRVETQNLDIGQGNHEELKLEGFLRWGFELELIFKFLLILNFASSCNMNV